MQDVWITWNEADQAAIDNAEAWLVTTTTRRAIDRRYGKGGMRCCR